MARPLRSEYPGAVYHVCACANQALVMFRDDRNRRHFLPALGERAGLSPNC